VLYRYRRDSTWAQHRGCNQAECCIALQCIAVFCIQTVGIRHGHNIEGVLEQCVAACCSVLQCVAVCCIYTVGHNIQGLINQCGAVCCSGLYRYRRDST